MEQIVQDHCLIFTTRLCVLAWQVWWSPSSTYQTCYQGSMGFCWTRVGISISFGNWEEPDFVRKPSKGHVGGVFSSSSYQIHMRSAPNTFLHQFSHRKEYNFIDVNTTVVWFTLERVRNVCCLEFNWVLRIICVNGQHLFEFLHLSRLACRRPNLWSAYLCGYVSDSNRTSKHVVCQRGKMYRVGLGRVM